MNKKGAGKYKDGIQKIIVSETAPDTFEDYIIIDTRNETEFKKGHYANSINLINADKFETWLGSIIAPKERFYLLADNRKELQTLIERIAKIGYEGQVIKAFVAKEIKGHAEEKPDVEKFRNSKQDYTIIDVRNVTEVKERKIFENSINIPLQELRERANEIPTDKPIIVHCAGGYRSAAGAGIIKNVLQPKVPVFDLSNAIETF